MAGALLAGGLFGGGAPWNGAGYIAGEPPDGLVTVVGAPSARYVYALERASRQVAGGAWSAVDGTWRIDNLRPAVEFDVIGRDYAGIYIDSITPRVRPEPYAIQSLTGAFAANSAAMTLDGAVDIFGGEAHVITVTAGAAPPGITFDVVNGGPPTFADIGRWLIATGTTDPGTYTWTLTITAANGSSIDLPCSATFT